MALSTIALLIIPQDDQGVFSGVVTNADWLETFGHPGSGLEGIIVSIYNLVRCFTGVSRKQLTNLSGRL